MKLGMKQCGSVVSLTRAALPELCRTTHIEEMSSDLRDLGKVIQLLGDRREHCSEQLNGFIGSCLTTTAGILVAVRHASDESCLLTPCSTNSLSRALARQRS